MLPAARQRRDQRPWAASCERRPRRGAAAPRETTPLPARRGEERLSPPVVRTGMFGVHGTPDTSGYGSLQVHQAAARQRSEPPYGGYFDAVAAGARRRADRGR